MKSHETTEMTGIELLHDRHSEACDLLDPDEIALVHILFSILDEWDREAGRSAN
jgi:hypothetical protein